MKSKQLIRFYFKAEVLNAGLDEMMMRCAYKSGRAGGLKTADKIISIIETKMELQGLWAYLDGAMNRLSGNEREVLKFYGGLRVGIRRMPDECAREIKRCAAKFTRRVKRVGAYGNALRLLGRYYCLL